MWGEAEVNSRKGGCTVQGPHAYLECKFPPACPSPAWECSLTKEQKLIGSMMTPEPEVQNHCGAGIFLEALGTCQAEDCHVEMGGY